MHWMTLLPCSRKTTIVNSKFSAALGHVWTAPWQELFGGCRYGRVRSRVRPFGAALMTAGPNAFRRSGPNRKRALDGALTREGLSDPWIRHVCITSFSPSQFRSWALG
jgi:hypothetical protein